MRDQWEHHMGVGHNLMLLASRQRQQHGEVTLGQRPQRLHIVLFQSIRIPIQKKSKKN